MDEKYVCACGLICSDCMFYKREIYETANKLRKQIDKTKMDVFLSILSKEEVSSAMADHLCTDKNELSAHFKAFSKLPAFLEVLDGLINIQCEQTCRETGGCSMCGTTKRCVTVKCVEEKGLNGCWECDARGNCDKLSFQRRSYGRTIEENLAIIHEKGVEAVVSRGDDYYEWQRKIKE